MSLLHPASGSAGMDHARCMAPGPARAHRDGKAATDHQPWAKIWLLGQCQSQQLCRIWPLPFASSHELSAGRGAAERGPPGAPRRSLAGWRGVRGGRQLGGGSDAAAAAASARAARWGPGGFPYKAGFLSAAL